MTPELKVLALAGLLQVIQYALMSIPANLQLGIAKTLSPRDPQRLGKPLMEQVTPAVGRLFRAMNNHFEALILFTIAVIVITLSGKSTSFTQTAAWIFLAARVLYVPAYALGLTPWRTLVWGLGFLATTSMLIAALL